MPLLVVKLVEGVFSSKQKREMIRKLTDAKKPGRFDRGFCHRLTPMKEILC
jgi:hypothetical protein